MSPTPEDLATRLRRLPAAVLLVLAGLALFPAVYGLIASPTTNAAFGRALTIALGLLAMGLAWAGGCHLERRREVAVWTIAGLGVAQLAVAPATHAFLGATPLVVGSVAASGALALIGLGARWRSP